MKRVFEVDYYVHYHYKGGKCVFSRLQYKTLNDLMTQLEARRDAIIDEIMADTGIQRPFIYNTLTYFGAICGSIHDPQPMQPLVTVAITPQHYAYID